MLKLNLIANFLGQGWVSLMGFVFVPAYIRYLGVEAFGVIGLYSILQASLSVLDFGMTPTLSWEIARFTGGDGDSARIRDLLRTVEFVAFSLALTIAIGVWLGAGWLSSSWLRSEALPPEIIAQSIAVMGVVSALRLLEGIYRGCIIGLQRQVFVNAANSSIATIRGLGAVAVLAWVSPTVQAYFIWQAATAVLTFAVFAVRTYQLLPRANRKGRFSIDSWRDIRLFAGAMFAISFLNLFLSQIDKVLLSKILTLKEFGYYTLAALVASTLFTFVYPITQAWFPRLSQLQAANDMKTFTRTYHSGAQLISVCSGSVSVILIVFSEVLIRTWTHDADLAHHTAPVLRLLLIGNLLNALFNMPYQAQLAFRWTDLALKLTFGGVVFIVPTIFWAVPRYGLEGAGWAWVCLNAGFVLIGTHLMHRRILVPEELRWWRNDVLSPIFLAAVSAFCLRLVLLPSTEGVLYWVVFVLGCGLTAAMACIGAPIVRHQTVELVLQAGEWIWRYIASKGAGILGLRAWNLKRR